MRCATATATMTAVIAAAVLTGCSSGPVGPGGAVACGSTHTGVGVPVEVQVAKGSVGCSTALAVESKYAKLVKDGDVKGNGGGAPVSVNGWTCQGYLYPQILATGDTSACRSGNTEIVEVLPVPTPTVTS
jgi:hypothetical protein